jgi:hypothetical protein
MQQGIFEAAKDNSRVVIWCHFARITLRAVALQPRHIKSFRPDCPSVRVSHLQILRHFICHHPLSFERCLPPMLQDFLIAEKRGTAKCRVRIVECRMPTQRSALHFCAAEKRGVLVIRLRSEASARRVSVRIPQDRNCLRTRTQFLGGCKPLQKKFFWRCENA